jgi:hypothetical protein
MTAEIAILNKSGIALATDSKVTIGSSGGKTFDSVNKVFALSKASAVGLMVFGNAEFMGVPYIRHGVDAREEGLDRRPRSYPSPPL